MRRILMVAVTLVGLACPAAAQTVMINGPAEPTTVTDPTTGAIVPGVIVNLTILDLPVGPGTYRIGADWYRPSTDDRGRVRYLIMNNYWGDDWQLPADGAPVCLTVTLFSNNPPGILPIFDDQTYWLEVWVVADGVESGHDGTTYYQPPIQQP